MVAKVTWFVCVLCAVIVVSSSAWSAECLFHWSFDDAAGALARDSVGGRDGLVQGPIWVAGHLGSALKFDGDDDYVSLPDNEPVWLPRNDFSISFWVCFDEDPASSDAGQEVLLDFNSAASSHPGNELGYLILRRGVSGRLSFQMATAADSDDDCGSSTSLRKDRWYHIVAVRDGVTQSLYVDGELERQRECSFGPIDFVGGYDDNAVNVGCFTTSMVSQRYHFMGMFDEIKIFEGGLSAEEVVRLFEGEADPDDESWLISLLAGGDPNHVTRFETVQEAIDAAQDGDTVNLLPGVYREDIRFRGKAITVQGTPDAAVLEASGSVAVSFDTGESRASILRNLIIRDSQIGIRVVSSSPTITNVTVVRNSLGIDCVGNAEPEIRNSIFWDNAVGDVDGCQVRYCCIERYSEGQGNLSDDPLFVDPNNGDYHLRSERGRYWPEHGVWVLDDLTSPCLDAGDPTADCSRERKPNGGRLNLGAYGGTAFASMSESPFRTDFDGDRIVDITDLELFTDVWEQEVEETASAGR